MAMLWFTPFGDRYSEATALAKALQAWLATQPEQPVHALRVELTENEDGSLSAITTAPQMRLVK